ncbi:MAG: MATE family efflux transporter [Deinococcales bacterium]
MLSFFHFLAKNQLNRQIIKLALPLMLQNLSYTLLGVADTFFVSRVSTDAVAAVGLAGVLFFAVMLLFRSTATSSVVFIGQAHGAQDDKALGKAVWQVLNVVFWLSILALLVLPWFYRSIFSLISPQNAPQVLAFGKSYLTIRAFEVPFAMFSGVVWGFLVGRGDSRTPMILAWVQVIINIILDWLLVEGNLGMPALGVAGAAYATVMANLLNAALSAYILWQKEYRQRYDLSKIQLASTQEMGHILKIALPMGLGDFLEVSAFTAFFTIIGQLGTDILAANNISLQYMSLSFTLGMGIGMAASSLVAQKLGAKDPDSAEKVGYQASYLAMIVMGFIGLSYLIAPAWLMSLFSQDAGVIAAGVTVLKLVAFYQVIDALTIVLASSLNGAGDTRFTMIARALLSWLFFIPFAWYVALKLDKGIWGAWFTALFYLGALMLVYLWRFRSGKWKSLELVITNP